MFYLGATWVDTTNLAAKSDLPCLKAAVDGFSKLSFVLGNDSVKSLCMMN